MLVRITESSEHPLYAQIAASVREDIAAGRLAPGAALPPARELSAGLEINVHTVLRAYQLLRDEGLIDLKRRRGAVITPAAGAMAELRGEVAALVQRAVDLGVSGAALAALVASAVPAALSPDPDSAGAAA